MSTPSRGAGKTVHRRDIDYTNMWPILLAPVIPVAGILLKPYPQYRWPVIASIGGAILLGAHSMVIGSGVNTK